LYPAEEPTCYCVGFSETYKGRTKYADTQVPLSDAANKTDEEIAQIAWGLLSEVFGSWRASVESKPPLVGSVFTPAA